MMNNLNKWLTTRLCMDSHNSKNNKPIYKQTTPEPFDINVSDPSGYSTLFKAIFGTLGLLVIIYALTRLLLILSPYVVSVDLENRIFKHAHLVAFKKAKLSKPLTEFAKKLVPENKNVEVYRIDMPIPNAFCFLGNKLFITNKLINDVESENELAFIIAHELGHAKNRDNLKNLSVNLVMSLFFGFIDFLKPASQFLALGYSRSMETKADEFALKSTKNLYGHTLGAETFFLRLKNKPSKLKVENFAGNYLSTHPDTDKRVEMIRKTQVSASGKTITRAESKILKAL